MKSIAVFLGFLVFSFMTYASESNPAQSEYLSLDGQPVVGGNDIEILGGVHLVRQFKAPVLWMFRSKAAAVRGTVLVCPGGGYSVLEMKGEGANTAKALNEMGFDAAVLEYHIASGANERELALADALKAFRLLRSQGQALGLHNHWLGIMGYSAGGHLAARTAGSLPAAEQLDAAILIYPAYLDETAPNSSVASVAPPVQPHRLFVLIAKDDNAKWVQGGQDFVNRWNAAGGKAEFHLLPGGGHGFGMADKAEDSNLHWPEILKQFLSEVH